MKGGLLAFVCMLFILAPNPFNIPDITHSSITRDYWPTEEWRLSTPEEQGMNSSILNMTTDYIENDDTIFHSLLVIRNGYIVYEDYFAQYHKDRRHIIFSCTKSVTSTLIGLAIEQGYIESVNEPILNYFPDKNITNWDTRKNDITIEHLLTMTSGLEWTEGAGDDDYFSMGFSDDWAEYVLSQPMIADPGVQFEYCTGGSHLLSAIVNVSTEQNTNSFAQENLFGPIGIDEVYWPVDPQGINNGGSDLGMTPRDMARFGYLFLNNGTWDDNQIVPTDWVTEATSTKLNVSPTTGYAYQWWTIPSMNIYSARGYAGQLIVIIPDYDLVVVCTADDQLTEVSLSHIISNYIIPSVEEYDPLFIDPVGPVTLIVTGVSIIALVIVFVYLRKSR